MEEALYNECLFCYLADAARSEGERPAILFEEATTTYRDLYEAALHVAAELKTRGVRPGDVIATVAHNSSEYVSLFFGCLAAGAVWAPLNVSLAPTEIRTHVELIQAHTVVFSADFEPSMIQAQIRDIAAVAQMDELFRTQRSHFRVGSEEHAHISGATSGWIIFSGATTGKPKAIELPISWANASSDRIINEIQLTQDDIFYSVLQMYHAWQPLHVVLGAVKRRATVAMRRWFSASQWLADVQRYNATVVDPLAPMIAAILRHTPHKKKFDTSIRVCINAVTDGTSSSMDNRIEFEKVFGTDTVNIYGLTEAGAMVLYDRHGGGRRESPARLGMRPSGDYEVRVASETGWPVCDGDTGEILVRPRFPGLIAKGYVGDSARTVEAWRDLWIHTGDRGRLLADESIEFAGRDAFWIRRRGENLSAIEVEDVLRDVCPNHEVAVVGVAGELGEQEVMAFIEGELSTSDLAEIHSALHERLAYFKVPRYYQNIAVLPRTVKGDVARAQLVPDRQRYWDAGGTYTPSGK